MSSAVVAGSSSLKAIIGLLLTFIVAGVVGYVAMRVIFPGGNSSSQGPPQPVDPVGPTGGPAPPPAPGIPETTTVWIYNDRDSAIYVIPTYGSATDKYSPRWTDWPIAPDTDPAAGAVVVPHTKSLAPTYIEAGHTGTFSVFTAGMASLQLSFRTDCVTGPMICKYGDSTYVEVFDGPKNALHRNSYPSTPGGPPVAVPFKPAINTLVEMTWGCAYKDTSLCAINPSCVTDPENCQVGNVNFADFMKNRPEGSIIKSNGLLYNKEGQNIPLQVGAQGAAVGGLSPGIYLDVSCVDGYTIPLQLYVKRPANTDSSDGVACRLKYSDEAPVLDPTADWTKVADTSQFLTCPEDELIFPAQRSVIALAGTGTDGYNSNVGALQYPMPYRTTAVAGSSSIFTDQFYQGSTTALGMYRNPTEVAVMKTFNAELDWTIQQMIGCASPCSVLTKVGAVSQQFPILNGKTFSPSSYFKDTSNAPAATTAGIAEICCKPSGSVVTDSNKQCNTTTWWVGNNTVNNLSALGEAPKYAFGFYVHDYSVPKGSAQDSPWWDGTDADPQSKNPYGGPNTNPEWSGSSYVAAVRGGETGQHQMTRAYAYAHDDPYNTILCGVVANQNLAPQPDSRGEYYKQYSVLIKILKGDPK